jgi:hypothetical protein
MPPGNHPEGRKENMLNQLQYTADTPICKDANPLPTPFDFLEEADIPDGALPEPKEFKCGDNWGSYTDPDTGAKIPFKPYCGKWPNQECPICFGRRRDGFQYRISNAIEDGISVYVVPLNSPEARRLRGELGKEDYLRLPSAGPDGGRLFYNASGRAKIGRQVLSIHDVDADTWDAITDTPEHKKPSGNLGRHEPTDAEKEADPDYQKVETEAVITHPDTKDVEGKTAMAWATAEERSAHLDPHTPAEVERAILIRTNIYCEELQKLGVHILKRKLIKRWVQVSRINWQILLE